LLPFAIIGCFTNLYIAYQSLIFTITFFCGIFTYIAVNKIYKNTYAAAVGSLLFTFAVYRLFDIYLRGALGETITFTFMPLVAWGFYEILKGDYKKWYILTIAYFLLINTHIISTVLIFLFMALFGIIYYKSFVKEPVRLIYLMLSGLATIFAGAYFIFPLLEQMLSSVFWVTARPALNFNHGTFTLTECIHALFYFLDSRGKVGALLTAMICLRFFIKGGKMPQLKSVDYGLFFGCICVVACWGYFPWNVFPFTLLHFIQFPWRFLQIAVYFFAIAGGFYASCLLKENVKGKFLFFAFLVAATCISFKMEISSNQVITQTTMDFQKTVAFAEYLPEKVSSIKYIEERGDKVASLHTGTEISGLARQKNGLSFSLKSSQKEILELPLIYDTGSRAELDGKELEIGESPNGLLEITAGKHGEVKVYYAGTVVQKISVWITLLSLLALIGYIFFRLLCQRLAMMSTQQKATT
jgi:hypothetical protein